jgi:glycosyltransferase involved in cell wall biosynthesis
VSTPQVLVFIDWYKPFFKAGGPVRSMVNLVEHLGDRIDFHIVTGDRDYTATVRPADLKEDQWLQLESGERVRYVSPEARTTTGWKRLLLDGPWDVVYINGLYSRWSTIMPLWVLRGSGMRRIVAVRGMLATGPMKQSTWKKRIFLFAMKALGCFDGVEFQATNAEEVQDIKRWIGGDTKVHLVRNLARKADPVPPQPIVKLPGTLKLVSLARIAEEKNTLFAIERLTCVQGTVDLDLYGTIYDEAYWNLCKAAIAKLPDRITVQWHGQLPQEDVARVLSEAHMLFMPSVGENFGHTMLESLSVGRPLLISDRTPWRSLLSAGAGWDLPLEEPERFERTLQQVIDMDQAAFDKLAVGAFALGERYLMDPAPVDASWRMFNP